MQAKLIGKILGGFGLLVLLTSPFTPFTSGSAWIAGVKAAVGLVFIGVFFATNFPELGQFASRRSTFFATSSGLLAIALLAVLTGVNYIAAKRNKTWDLTTKKIHSLAPQTVDALKRSKDKIRAIGFITADDPNYDALSRLFERYREIAPDKFEYSFKDPRKHPDLAAKYELREGQSTVVLAKGDGAAESHTTLNALSEQELTNAVIKINTVGEQKIYFTQGHGEWPLESPAEGGDAQDSINELRQTLGQEGYAPKTLQLAGEAEVPKDAALVVVAGGKTAFTIRELETLTRYLDEGGRLMVFVEPLQNVGLGKLLAQHGIQLDEGIVADGRFNNQSSPYVVVSLFFGEHEITRLLKQMQMMVEIPTARGLTILREGLADGVEVEPVVLTSPFAWVESKPDGDPTVSDGEKAGQIPLVVASKRAIPDREGRRYPEARVLVFADADLLLDPNWGHDPNRNLVMNSVAWASAEIEKITIRPPDRDMSTMDLDPDRLAGVQFIASDLLPLTLMGMGLAIWLTRRNR